jgi:hypothetical protein
MMSHDTLRELRAGPKSAERIAQAWEAVEASLEALPGIPRGSIDHLSEDLAEYWNHTRYQLIEDGMPNKQDFLEPVVRSRIAQLFPNAAPEAVIDDVENYLVHDIIVEAARNALTWLSEVFFDETVGPNATRVIDLCRRYWRSCPSLAFDLMTATGRITGANLRPVLDEVLDSPEAPAWMKKGIVDQFSLVAHRREEFASTDDA